jgi:hypothetical protein
MPQALAVLLAVTQIQAAEQAAAPPQTPAAAQTSPPAAPNPAPPPSAALPVEQSLKILVLAGNGEMNDLERRVMAPLVVQVLDQNDRPVDGAEVVFRFPLNGPTVNWMATGVGTFQVHVNASYGNQVGESMFPMSNVTRVAGEGAKPRHKSLWSHTWFKIAVIGGAAAAIGIGVFLATRGGSKSSGSTVTINPGSPTVGAP